MIDKLPAEPSFNQIPTKIDELIDNLNLLQPTNIAEFIPSSENSLPTPMTYNSSPTEGTHLKIFDGDNINPTMVGNRPSASFQRVDESPGTNDSRDHLSTLLVTHKRNKASRGYGFGAYNYLEDYSDSTFPSQSVACAGAAHSKDTSQVWGLYGEGWQHTTNGSAAGTGAEIDCFNYSGIDNEYNENSPFSSPHSKSLLLASYGTKKAVMALGITSSLVGQFRTGIYLALNSCDKFGLDIQSMPETLIRFKNGAKKDGIVGGIGLDSGKNASYGIGYNQGAIHLWDNTLAFGQSDICSYFMRIDSVNERLLFGRTEADGTITTKGYIDLSVGAVNHAL